MLEVSDVGVALVVVGVGEAVVDRGAADGELLREVGTLETGDVFDGTGTLEGEDFGVGTGSCVDPAKPVVSAL